MNDDARIASTLVNRATRQGTNAEALTVDQQLAAAQTHALLAVARELAQMRKDGINPRYFPSRD